MKIIFCLIVLIGLGIAGYRYIGEKKTGDPKTAQKMRQEKESASKESKKKESPKLEFLDISVNESEEKIKAHLLNRGFKDEGNNRLSGRFWLLEEPSIAEIIIQSGEIKIEFSLNPSDKEMWRRFLQGSNEAWEHLSELQAKDNIFIRKYFDALQIKYKKAQLVAKNTILLEDGLIEFFQTRPPVPSSVVFYNRKAAEKRLQEIKTEYDESQTRLNDI